MVACRAGCLLVDWERRGKWGWMGWGCWVFGWVDGWVGWGVGGGAPLLSRCAFWAEMTFVTLI